MMVRRPSVSICNLNLKGFVVLLLVVHSYQVLPSDLELLSQMEKPYVLSQVKFELLWHRLRS